MGLLAEGDGTDDREAETPLEGETESVHVDGDDVITLLSPTNAESSVGVGAEECAASVCGVMIVGDSLLEGNDITLSSDG